MPTETAPAPSEALSADHADRAKRQSDRGRFLQGGRWWPGAVCLGLYVLLTFLEFGPSTSLGAGRIAVEGGSDGTSQIWFLQWTEYALAHGHNPFFSHWQSYPGGINVVSDTSMVALGAIFSPITALFGPIVTWNVLLHLAVILSAFSMCLVLRRWTTWWPAAFIGGAIYGYSAYVSFNLGHLFLVFVPLPPIMFLLLYEILVRQTWRPVGTGAVLGALCAVQYLISSEVLVTTVLIGVIATVMYAYVIAYRGLRTKWRYIGVSLGSSVLVGGVLLAYPVAFTLFGPEHLNGAPQSPATLSALHGDLLAPLAAPSSAWLSPLLGKSVFSSVSPTGETLYLGLPLVLVLVVTVVWLWKRRIVLFASVLMVVAFVLSLGQRLYVDGHYTKLPLPFEVLAHLSYTKSLLAIRFSLYTVMFAAGIASIALDELYRRASRSSRPSWLPDQWRSTAAVALPLAIGAALTLPFVASSAQATPTSGVAPFFSSHLVDAIPNGSVVLAYPYPKSPVIGHSYTDRIDQVLLDQAESGMRFKLIGGYGWWPVPHETYATQDAPPLTPLSVETFFDEAYYGSLSPARSAVLFENHVSDLRQFMKDHGVDAVIVLPVGKHPDSVIVQLTAAIGRPEKSGGVFVWNHVQQRLSTPP